MSGRDRRAGAAGPPVSRDARPREMGRVATGPVCDGDGASFLDPAVPRLRNPPRRDGPLHRGSTPGGAGTASKDTKSPVSEILDLMNPEVIARLRHSLRTPLNHIIGYAEIVRDEAEERGAGAHGPLLQEIGSAAGQILQAIQNTFNLDATGTGDGFRDLRRAIRPLLDRIAGLSQTYDERTSGAFSADLAKIRLAAEELAQFIRNGTLPGGSWRAATVPRAETAPRLSGRILV